MIKRYRRATRWVVMAAILLSVPLLLASHWNDVGWADGHRNYPERPSGYAQIVATFGQPCSEAAHAVRTTWEAWDNDKEYVVWFHRKLGGMDASITKDQGGRSTNLDNDIWGHLNTRHEIDHVKSGIWGYNCRYIAGTTTWSAHAWGIAVDVSAAYEHVGHYHSHVNDTHADIWERHRWYWGKAFGDAMHFQYADGY